MPSTFRSSYMRARGISIRKLQDRAWLEYRVTKQCATGSAHWLEQVHEPGWFRALELGLGWGEAPSLLYTLETLRETNRKNRAILRAQSQPPRITAKHRKRITAEGEMRRMRAMVQRAIKARKAA